MRVSYTKEQLDFLRDEYKAQRVPALTAAFNAKFGQSRTENAIKTTLTREGFKCGRKPGFMKGERLTYTPEQVGFIKDGYLTMDKHKLTEAFNREFGTNKGVNQIEAFIDNHKIRCGRTGRFEKGNIPWTAGVAGKGICKPNSGSFKKGDIPGNVRALGSERICPKDGFILVKIEEENPYTEAKTRFKHKHVVIWEGAHGPTPEGHVIRFLDGDKLNCVLENLGLFTRAESLQMTRLGFSDVPDDFKPTIIAMAKLDSKRFELARAQSEISKSAGK